MASSAEYVRVIAGQLNEAGEIKYRKMFGEYGIYCDGIYFGAVCDNRFLIKPTQASQELLSDAQMEPPYDGGKPMVLIEELEDKGFLAKLVRETCAQLPKKKK